MTAENTAVASTETAAPSTYGSKQAAILELLVTKWKGEGRTLDDVEETVAGDSDEASPVYIVGKLKEKGIEVSSSQVSQLRRDLKIASTREKSDSPKGKAVTVDKSDSLQAMLAVRAYAAKNGGLDACIEVIQEVEALLDEVGGIQNFLKLVERQEAFLKEMKDLAEIEAQAAKAAKEAARNKKKEAAAA